MGKEINLLTKEVVNDSVILEDEKTEQPVVEAETKTADEQSEVEFKDFEFGDLCIACSACGHEEVFVKGLEGIRIDLPATNKHELVIVCSKCKNKLRLFYKESANIEELRVERDARIEALKAVQASNEESNNEVKVEENGSGIVE